MNPILKGSDSFKWQAEVDGQDILILNGWATAFGDIKDIQSGADNGLTSCGITLKLHPDFMGVALPIPGYGIKSLRGSPLPHMPYGADSHARDIPTGAHVIVEDVVTGRRSPVVPFCELGPSGYTGNVIDLTVPLARLFQPNANGNNFKRRMNVRILGAAKYLS